MKVAVIGAGVVGVTTAHYLRTLNFEVTVYDAAAAPATKTSKANAGQLSYSFTDAMADPSLIPKLASILLRQDPAFRIHPTLNPRFVKWSCQFIANCTTRRAANNTLVLLRTAMKSAYLMKEFHEQFGSDYCYQPAGKIVVPVEGTTSRIQQQLANKQNEGCDVSLIPYERALEIEPTLETWNIKPQPVIYAPGDEVGDSQKFTLCLANKLKKKGVTFYFDSPVLKLERRHGKIAHIVTKSSKARVDAVVVCTGNSAQSLLAPLGESLPIYPMAGYSITLPRVKDSPNTSITALNKKIVFSRMGNSIRIAGFADINAPVSGYGKRLKQLCLVASELAPQAANFSSKERYGWTGFRPMTPDSLPIVRPGKTQGLYINTGHGMLGWTLCAATSYEIANQIAQQCSGSKLTTSKEESPAGYLSNNTI